MSNMCLDLAEEFKKQKVCSSFIDNISGTNLADMKLISKFNKIIHFQFCVFDIFSKYVWVIIPLKNKKGITITYAFQKILEECNGKPSKIWVDKSSAFYNRSMKSWLEKNAV